MDWNNWRLETEGGWVETSPEINNRGRGWGGFEIMRGRGGVKNDAKTFLLPI